MLCAQIKRTKVAWMDFWEKHIVMERGTEVPRNLHKFQAHFRRKKMKNYPIEMDHKPQNAKTGLFKRNENSIECDAWFVENNKNPCVHLCLPLSLSLTLSILF